MRHASEKNVLASQAEAEKMNTTGPPAIVPNQTAAVHYPQRALDRRSHSVEEVSV